MEGSIRKKKKMRNINIGSDIAKLKRMFSQVKTKIILENCKIFIIQIQVSRRIVGQKSFSV